MKTIFIFIIGALALTACSEDIKFEMPDNFSNQVQFTVGDVLTGETTVSRAEDYSHEHTVLYRPDVHPNQLGAFACYGKEVRKVTMSSYEQQTQADSTIYVWKSDVFWPEISDNATIDFIGYMCDESLPEATYDKDSHTLSFPAALTAPVLTSATVDKAPLVCCKPNTVEKIVSQVVFNMDRTLTGYTVWFQLGPKMDAIRDFVIKDVCIYGEAPKAGTVNVTYGAGSKTVTWDNLGDAESFGPLPLTWTDKPLVLNNTTADYMKWGNDSVTGQAFFAIPSEDFNPTIKVTYDVIVDNDGPIDGNQGIVTRKDVVSTITLNKANFTSLAKGETGKVHPIKIKIVPSYLYVLADEDETTTGYITLQ